jgi:hypothetical protein
MTFWDELSELLGRQTVTAYFPVICEFEADVIRKVAKDKQKKHE